jgi:hypothetical protein
MSPREADNEQKMAGERDEPIPDLDLTEDVDVVGGALNAYVSAVQGEKQSGARG